MAEDYVNFLTNHAVPKAMSLSEIQLATKSDKTLQCLAEAICTGQWETLDLNEKQDSSQGEHVNYSELNAFRRVKEELTVNSQWDVILRRNRIVMPVALQDRAIEIATKDL